MVKLFVSVEAPGIRRCPGHGAALHHASIYAHLCTWVPGQRTRRRMKLLRCRRRRPGRRHDALVNHGRMHRQYHTLISVSSPSACCAGIPTLGRIPGHKGGTSVGPAGPHCMPGAMDHHNNFSSPPMTCTPRPLEDAVAGPAPCGHPQCLASPNQGLCMTWEGQYAKMRQESRASRCFIKTSVTFTYT